MDMRAALLRTFADECDEILAELERLALTLAEGDAGEADAAAVEAMYRATTP